MGTSLPVQIGLNDQERAFARGVGFYGLEPEAAATRAGFSPAVARQAKFDLMREPKILAAIQIEVGRRLIAGVSKNLAAVDSVLEDPKQPGAKVKLEAARYLLSLAGHVAPRAHVPDAGGDKQLSEMTIEDLRAQRDTLESEIAGRAKSVSAPTAPPSNSEAIDLLS